MNPPPESRALHYMQAVQAKLEAILEHQLGAVLRAAELAAQCVQHGGMIYLFGTGHSHMLAEEGHYRAGGLAPVCPILNDAIMLHEGAVFSTMVERTSGLAEPLLERYQPKPDDVLFIFSNSGVNTLPVEMAQAARRRGMKIVAIVALAYAATVPAGPHGVKLADLADIVLDNHGVAGDALVEVGKTGLRTGPFSTIGGAFLLNAVLTEVACRLAESRLEHPPIYISANMAGAAAHNAHLVAEYRRRNPHL
jgi:uncharacterized phosphosugar-binding protein